MAEDSAINRLVAVRILELAGHSVVTVENGKEALVALRESAFDIVLMDVQMPIMDGFEATAMIRAQEKDSGQHMPIVAMTAHAMKGDRERCLEAGVDGYVAKPILEEDMFAAIEAAVAGNAPPIASDGSNRPSTSKGGSIIEPRGVDLCEQDEAFQRELAFMFLEDCPQSLAEVRAAVATRNGLALKLAAHSLKNSARILKDEGATAAALRTEAIGRDGDWEHAVAASLVLTREMSRLTAAMIDLVTQVESLPITEMTDRDSPNRLPTGV